MNFSVLGKTLIIIGVICVLVGILLFFFNKIPFVGKLPGDIFIQKKNFTFYFPVMTSIILSILLTIIFYLINKFRQ